MTARERLPDRRFSETFAVQADTLFYRATVSFFPDGRPGEIFLTGNKAGSPADAAARDAAIAASFALQFGCPLDDLRSALTRDGNGTASSVLGAALDLIEVTEGVRAGSHGH